MSRAYDMRPKNAAPQIFGAPEIPESKERRLTELTLLHHYQTVTSYTVNRPDQYTKEWSIKIPRLAFKHDALLYAIYTCASLHLASLEPQEPKHVENYQKYLGLCLRLHRDDVAKLSTANADAAMMTSTILRVCTFALLQERVLEPYIPPIEWLHMNSGTGHGLAVASWKYIKDDPNSIMRGLMANVPGLSKDSKWLRDDDLIFKESNRKELNHLLRRTPENEINEIWNEEVQTAISTTVSYVGAVLEAIAAREGEAMVFRRLILFPTVVEKSFIALIEERNPRALVVLAHYFALLTRFSDFWWIGQLGPREVRAIQRHLGNEWQDLMVWPMKTIEGGPAILQPVPPE
jgi:Fungal specific transcription factor domain